MGWRSILITNKAYLSLGNNALQIKLESGSAQVPLEDISVVLIDHPQVTLSAQLLSACAEAQIVLITVGSNHHPNGVLLPFLPHSRTLKIMQAQLTLRLSLKKQLHKKLIQQKILNQAIVLSTLNMNEKAEHLTKLATRIRSGDPNNIEAQAAQIYFANLFTKDFNRSQERFYNNALNYGYAVLRAAIARNLVCHGFLPVLGLFHHNEQNAFNLADDLIEPYRPVLDHWVIIHYPSELNEPLSHKDKANLISLLHNDIKLTTKFTNANACTVLSGIEATVISLSRIVLNDAFQSDELSLPTINLDSTGSSQIQDSESNE